LLPALKQARLTARRVVCMNNLRQQGAAFAQHINDFDGNLPQTGNNNTTTTYPGLVRKFMTNSTLFDYTAGSWRPWVCPEYYQTNTPQFGGGYGYTMLNPRDWTSSTGDGLKWMAHLNSGSRGWFGYPNNPYYRADVEMATRANWVPTGWTSGYLVSERSQSTGNRFTLLRNPAQIGLCVEMFPKGIWSGQAEDGRGGNARHGGIPWDPKGGHVLYGDGRVRWSTDPGLYLSFHQMVFSQP
jgi:hypothetical protein